MKICVIEDEQSIARLISYDLKNAGYEVSIVHDGAQAKEIGLRENFDVFVIDWMLPHVSGIDLVRHFRQHHVSAIMLMLTAKDEETDILDAFEAGVDDYMTKPFSPRELLARIKAHSKRVAPSSKAKNQFEDILIDDAKRQVLVNSKVLTCTKKEFDLLTYLVNNHDIVLTRDDILNGLWNFDYDGDTRIVDVHIFKLRAKLEDSACEIASIRGVGYVLQKKST